MIVISFPKRFATILNFWLFSFILSVNAFIAERNEKTIKDKIDSSDLAWTSTNAYVVLMNSSFAKHDIWC